MLIYQKVTDIPSGTWRWPNFSPSELEDKNTGAIGVESILMDALERLRAECGFPIPLSSGYRSPAHSEAVGGSATDPHTLGLAVDVAIVLGDTRAYPLVRAAFRVGFVGIEPRGDHIHLDLAPSRPDAPRPLMF